MINSGDFRAVAWLAMGALSATTPAAYGADRISTEPTQDLRCQEERRQFVPVVLAGSEDATRIADAYFKAVFGEEEKLPSPYRYRFDVKLQDGVWSVDKLVSAPPSSDGLPHFFVGGGLHILLCQSNGRVLELYGTQ